MLSTEIKDELKERLSANNRPSNKPPTSQLKKANQTLNSTSSTMQPKSHQTNSLRSKQIARQGSKSPKF